MISKSVLCFMKKYTFSTYKMNKGIIFAKNRKKQKEQWQQKIIHN